MIEGEAVHVAVVPDSWITNSDRCYWPTHMSSTAAVAAVKKRKPPQHNWKTYEVILRGSFGKAPAHHCAAVLTCIV